MFAMSGFVIAHKGMAVEAEGALVTKTTELSVVVRSWAFRCAAGPALGPAGVHWAEFVNESGGVGMYCGLCLLYTSPSPRDRTRSRMPSSA